MKPYLRVSAVTAALQALLLPWVQEVAGEGMVAVGRPFDRAKKSQFQGVNVYLFHVERNPSVANRDLPTRNEGGALVGSPTAAIDVYYLLSFYGDEASLVPQKFLGNTITAVHSWPVLFGDLIASLSRSGNSTLLAESGLSEQGARVHFSLVSMTIDETMRLWTVFQVPYTLSVALKASVILLEAAEEPPPEGIVAEVDLTTWPSASPGVALVHPELSVGETLRLSGREVAGRQVLIGLGDREWPPDANQAGDLSLALTAARVAEAKLQPGQVVVQVREPDGHLIDEAEFTLLPAITKVTRKIISKRGQAGPVRRRWPREVELRVAMAPQPPAGTAITLRLTPLQAGDPVEGEATATDDGGVVWNPPPLQPGPWRVTARVDGVWSRDSDDSQSAVVKI